MSVQDSIHSVNHNGFNGNGDFKPNFDDLTRALDSPYSPGILETEIMSNRSSIFSDTLNLNDKSLDFINNRDSLKSKLNNNYGEAGNIKTKDGFEDGGSSDSQSGSNTDSNLRRFVGSMLDGTTLGDVDGLSMDDDVNWLSSQSPSHAVSSNALNLVSDESEAIKKAENKSNHPNPSPLKRYSSGKIEKFSDFGQVTQIIGVPPLSASNKDLSSIGKELSLNKQQDFENTDSNHNQATLSVSNSKLNFGSGYVLADFSDVQNAAKLQEQSLRMSFSTPLVSKGLSLKASNKKLNETSAQSKPKGRTATPGRSDRGSVVRSPARSTAPLSQFNSNAIMSKNHNEPYQKSLPNLTRKLQAVRGQTEGRVQRSMLPHSGPPVRTASQPAVTSQLKPFQRSQPQRTTSTQLKPQSMSLNQRNPTKTSFRAPPTSLTSSRLPATSRQPLTTRQPLSSTNRQPLNTSRQPSTLSRQPLTPSRQPLSTTTRQPLSSTTRVPLGSRVPANTTPRTNTSTTRMPSGTRTPLNGPPIRTTNTPQLRNRTTAPPPNTMTRNPPSLLNRTNQSTTNTRTNLPSTTTRTNLSSSRTNTSMIRGSTSATNTRSNPPLHTTTTMGNRTRPVSNLNTTSSTTAFSGRLNTSSRVPLPSSSLLRNPPNRAPNTIKATSTARSNTPRNPTTSPLNKARLVKPSPVPPPSSNRGDNGGENEDWKYGCF